MQWAKTKDPKTGKKHYRLANFETEEKVAAAGYHVTHAGHCATCSSLEDLGLYMSG